MARIDYGIDAPGALRNLLLIGTASLIVSYLAWHYVLGTWLWNFRHAFLSIGCVLVAEGILMLLYSKLGKFRHRDRLMKLAALRGHERVLDVGTGRGLLAVGAAKQLPQGSVVGIDIWKTEDLSRNARAMTEAVIQAEGVADRVEIREADATQLPFENETFDAVISNLCLHNIYNVPGRQKAIQEIARVLKPGGRAVISDFKHVGNYADYFRAAGISMIEIRGPYLFDTFPPLRVVIARKGAQN